MHITSRSVARCFFASRPRGSACVGLGCITFCVFCVFRKCLKSLRIIINTAFALAACSVALCCVVWCFVVWCCVVLCCVLLCCVVPCCVMLCLCCVVLGHVFGIIFGVFWASFCVAFEGIHLGRFFTSPSLILRNDYRPQMVLPGI